MPGSAIRSLTIYPLAIPLRRKISHAASERVIADPVVVAVELDGGVMGYGETLARPYVTGETAESVVNAIRNAFLDDLLRMNPQGFSYALEAIDALPWSNPVGQSIPAARAAIELALLDAYSRKFNRPITEAVGWLGFNEFGRPGCIAAIRHSGVITSRRLTSTKRSARAMWWFGLRDFKLKVGMDGDEKRLDWMGDYLAHAIRRGKASLRLDANGAWQASEATQRLMDWKDHPLAFVEQPLHPSEDHALVGLKQATGVRLMHDESLVTQVDAERLLTLGVADGFNIRISKCGGLLPSLKLAHFAARRNIVIQLGCMVGETTILSAAARRFLECVPGVRFVEGNFGSFLLTGDVTRRSIRFDYGGRVRPLPDFGWGVDVDPAKLRAWSLVEPVHLTL